MGRQIGIRVFQTVEHACGYWPERSARDLVLDPADPALAGLYGSALAMGFRRSGAHVYRPNCADCRACTPVRIPVRDFRPSRSQRRTLARNADLRASVRPAACDEASFALYRRYVGARHAGGGMDDPTPAEFENFLSCSWSPTCFLELHEGEELVAVAVTDVLGDSLSAVYTFFDPSRPGRSLGTQAILAQVEYARRLGLRHVYLGFWLEGHPKMDYKRRFRPLEFLDGEQWRTFPE
jgi:arginyl-tRNA--protein-N-Asp/Glu arginylyltransferase